MNKNSEAGTSNFKFAFVGKNTNNLLPAVSLAYFQYEESTGWSIEDDWLVFYWYDVKHYWKQGDSSNDIKYNSFPCKFDKNEVAEFVRAYLKKIFPLEERSNIDGSTSRGFEIKAGEASGWSYEIFRVRPIWALHHK